MKAKNIFCALAAAMLLCACQAEQPESTNSPSPAPEQTVAVEPSTPSQSESVPSKQLPPAPPVCEVEFTQTDSFPQPFEDELLLDEERGLLLSTEQALYDYDTMWLLLEENFPYLEAIKAEVGIDWRKVKAEYRLKLKNQAIDGYISQMDFMVTLYGCVLQFQDFGHLYVVDNRSFYLDRLQNATDDLSKNEVNLMRNPKSDLFYSYSEQNDIRSIFSTSNGSKKRGAEAVEITDRHDITENLITGTVGDGVPYLRIASFEPWDEKTYAKLAGFFSNISEEKHLIIDVRGNSGGSDGNWRIGIVPLLEQSELEFNMLFSAKSGSLNLELDSKRLAGLGRGVRYTDDSWQEDFPYVPPEAVAGLDTHLKVSTVFKKDNTQKYFSGKIWVLIDEGCYSATDAFACFCKESGFATLVGSTTSGNGKGGQPLFMALPYSGLIVRYEEYLTFNSDGTYNGIRGTVPDIVVEEGQSTLGVCLSAIMKENNNTNK